LAAGLVQIPRMPTQSKFKVGLVQMSCEADPEKNLAKVVACIREAAARGAQIISTQELFRSPYFCQKQDPSLFDLAEPIPGPSTRALSQVAEECGVVVVGSLFERRAPGLYHNTAVVFDADGTQLGLYRKMHIPDDPLYYEKYYFAPGDLGFGAFDTRFGRVGVLVCWDQWYPEGARLTALAGADVLFYPTAIGWHPSEKVQYGAAQADAWRTIQRSHAIANGVYVCAINRVGHEAGVGDGIEFWGGSFVADPFGVVLQEGSRTEEQILVVECDRAHQESVRRNWPFLRDRRVDAYGGITQRFLEGTAPGMKK
jgi:N-carbamoylputrescine amidase